MTEAQATEQGSWWQLSFDDRSKWPGETFQTIIVGPALSSADALQLVASLGFAPSGEMSARVLPDTVMACVDVSIRNRPLTRRDVAEMDGAIYAGLRKLACRHETASDGNAEPVTFQRRDAVPECRLTTGEEAGPLFYFGEGTTISERSPTGAIWQNHGATSEGAIAYENALRAGTAKLPNGDVFDRLGWPPLEYGRPGREAIYELTHDADGNVNGRQFTGRYEDTRAPVTSRGGAVIGYADQETVEITSEAHEGGGIEPNIALMFRWADCDKIMRAMISNDPAGAFAFEVLRIAYGPEGARWETLAQSGEKCFRGHGRLASLYASTAHGRRLLEWIDDEKRKRGQAVPEWSVPERMEAALRSAGTGSTWTEKERAIMRAMIERARRTAERDLWIASAAWRKAWSASQKEKPARERWTGRRKDEERECARIERDAKIAE